MEQAHDGDPAAKPLVDLDLDLLVGELRSINLAWGKRWSDQSVGDPFSLRDHSMHDKNPRFRAIDFRALFELSY